MRDFETTALPHLESVARFALSLTRNQSEADDLVQETFLRAFKGWHTFTPGTDCRRWLFTICRNTFVRLRSRKTPEVEPLGGDVDALPAAAAHARAARHGMRGLFDRIDVRPAIEQAVKRLPEPHHSILVLVDLEGLSYEEAAEVLEIPVGTVRSRLFRARRRIQEDLVAYAEDMGLVDPPRETPAPEEACVR